MTALESARPGAPFGDTDIVTAPLATAAARPRRQPKWIAAGVLAMCLGGLGATLVYAKATATHDVIQVTRSVSRGETIRAADLRVVRAGDLAGSSSVPADRASQLVGQKALIDLAGGAILPANAIGQPPVEKGISHVGLRLAPGRIPVGELTVGASVVLIPVEEPRSEVAKPAPQATPGASAAGPIAATIAVAPRVGVDGVSTLLDVRVPSDKARAVAELAASDRLVLVREG